MKLLSVTLYRFGSFTEETTFTFPDGPGLFFLRGDNREEPALEANGAGKSTLWNAICWCAFDRTVKGLRAGDVANWDSPKGAFVRICYQTSDGSTFAVTRQHSPNKWTLQCIEPHGDMDAEDWDLAKDDNNLFLSDLQLGLEPFLNCVLMGQGKPMFLDLDASKKAELFSDVLGLDVWLERSKRASKAAEEQDVAIRGLERRLAEAEGQLRSIDHAALEGSASEWRADNERRLRVIENRYAEAMKELKAKKEEMRAAGNAVESLRQCLRDAVENEAKAKQKRQQASEEARDARNAHRDVERWLEMQDDARKKLLALDDCPTCQQKVPHEHREQIDRRMQREMSKRRDEEQHLWRMSEGAAAAEKEAAHNLEIIADGVDTWRKGLRQAEDDYNKLRSDVAYLNKDLDRLEDEAERIHEERNPFASMKQEALDREETLQALRRHLNAQLDAAQARLYLLNYWVRGFKEVRLQLINDSLEQLEIEVNSNVAELGLHGWELRFDVDKETASGSVTKGFNVTVKSPHNDRPVPWKAWSGGEGQRLRVATQEGLADLIRTRTGADIDLEVWDEPTEHLSGQGVTDLLDSLRARAIREHRQIWVVDHRALGYGHFTNVVTVIKDSRGSYFETT